MVLIGRFWRRNPEPLQAPRKRNNKADPLSAQAYERRNTSSRMSSFSIGSRLVVETPTPFDSRSIFYQVMRCWIVGSRVLISDFTIIELNMHYSKGFT
jgi:hypothetical protein